MNALVAALAAVTLNHAVFAAAYFPPWLWALWLAFAAACLARGSVVSAAPGVAGRPGARAFALGILACVPIALPLAASWDREFGFGGDSSFHIGVASRLALWWASPPFSAPSPVFDFAALDAIRGAPAALAVSRAAILAAGLAALALVHRRRPRAAVAIAAFALFAWGAAEAAREFRYPALAYHAAFAFLPPAAAAGAPELAFRLANVAAAVVWLFVLRPLLLKRWPDAAALAVAAFVFWNDGFLAVLDAAYLEPWAIVFLALAVEARARGGPGGAPLACVLVGFAAATKEQAIFVLPFVWLSALPWRDPLGRGRDATLAAFAAGLPFLSFFAANRAVGQVRDTMIDMPDAATLEGLLAYADSFARSNAGLAPLGALLALAALAAWRDRAAALAFAAASAGAILFLVIERGSLGFAGMPRFLWLAFPAMAAGLFARRGVSAAVLAAALCAAQLPGVFAAVERAGADWLARSFVESFDAPFVFPIKSLMAESGLSADAPVTAIRPDPLIQAGAATGRQGAVVQFVDASPCVCEVGEPAILALAPPLTGFWAHGASPPDRAAPELSRRARWRAARDAMPACRDSLAASCERVLTREIDGRLVAVLGYSPRRN